MRQWVAGISFGLGIILLGIAGWNFFQHRYCNAQRLNEELAATHRPALLAQFTAQDRQRRDDELREFLCGGTLMLLAVTLWTGSPDPEQLLPRLRNHLTQNR